MFTSDIKNKAISSRVFLYLIISVLCALFGAVYEYFSHGVFSYFMLYAFGFPLVGGAIVNFIIIFFSFPFPSEKASNLYNSGIATLTVGCIFQGALEIYGTTNRLIWVYWAVGTAFVLLGVIFYLISLRRTRH